MSSADDRLCCWLLQRGIHFVCSLENSDDPLLIYGRAQLSCIMGKDQLKHMQRAKVQASLRICAVSQEPMLFARVSGCPK